MDAIFLVVVQYYYWIFVIAVLLQTDYVKEKFEDTAAFLTGTTGADGTARFTVKLPDNLTEWRLTPLALDSRTFWGPTKMPFCRSTVLWMGKTRALSRTVKGTRTPSLYSPHRAVTLPGPGVLGRP